MAADVLDTAAPLLSYNLPPPPAAPPLRFVRGYVMVWLTSLTLPVYFVNINGASARRVPFTRLTHTQMHTHVPYTPLCPSLPPLSCCLPLTQAAQNAAEWQHLMWSLGSL